MTEAMPFLQKYDITFLRPPTIAEGLLLVLAIKDNPRLCRRLPKRPMLLHCLRFYPPRRSTRLCRLGITGIPSASIVRRDAHIAPYNA